MNLSHPLFSIIIPTRNGGKYLPYCLSSLLMQNYDNVEIIVSDNNSQDNTVEFLKTITDHRVKKIKPEKILSMSAHYEFALSHAAGEWVMILGDDDGVMPYFFKIAEFLTQQAKNKNLKLINTARAYYFWDGCENLYKDLMIQYNAKNYISVESIKYQSFVILSAYQPYFFIPQMYTTSMFHRSIIEEVIHKQGRFYTAFTPDANGAAISISTEKYYLDCRIPFAWVGTSPKSAGVLGSNGFGFTRKNKAYKQEKFDEMFLLLKQFEKQYSWEKSCGKHEITSVTLYLYEALLKSSKIQTNKYIKLINSKMFKSYLFSGILYEINPKYKKNNDLTAKEKSRIEMLKEICKINSISFFTISFIYTFVLPICMKLFSFIEIVKSKKIHELNYTEKYEMNLNKEFTLLDAYYKILKLEQEHNYIENFIDHPIVLQKKIVQRFFLFPIHVLTLPIRRLLSKFKKIIKS